MRQGLLALLGMVTIKTGQPFDLSSMYVGTVHSLCNRLLTDRRFASLKRYRRAPLVMDQLDQYFFIYDRRFWTDAQDALGLPSDLSDFYLSINQYFNVRSQSRHQAVQNSFPFNRFSEESLDPVTIINRAGNDDMLENLADIYGFYHERLSQGSQRRVDLSLLQKEGLDILQARPPDSPGFKYVIIDEYQDTNAIQEKIFFELACQTKNICVVGDDDQALYRFRGATVENLVNFPERCNSFLSCNPHKILLNTNYRSRQGIVNFYCDFMERSDWSRLGPPVGIIRMLIKKSKLIAGCKSIVFGSTPGNGTDGNEETADCLSIGLVRNE